MFQNSWETFEFSFNNSKPFETGVARMATVVLIMLGVRKLAVAKLAREAFRMQQFLIHLRRFKIKIFQKRTF